MALRSLAKFGSIPRFQGGGFAQTSQNDRLRPNSTQIFANPQISPKKDGFWQTHVSVTVFPSSWRANFVQFRAISCNGWRAVSAAMFLACKFRANSCNFVQRLACGFCGDVNFVQISCKFRAISCNFVQFRAISCNGWRAVSAAMFLACKFRAIWCNFVASGFRSDVLGVQISCKFVAHWRAGSGAKFWQTKFRAKCKFAALTACKFCSEVCAIFGHAKFCEITRNFANFRAICLCADMFGKNIQE